MNELLGALAMLAVISVFCLVWCIVAGIAHDLTRTPKQKDGSSSLFGRSGDRP